MTQTTSSRTTVTTTATMNDRSVRGMAIALAALLLWACGDDGPTASDTDDLRRGTPLDIDVPFRFPELSSPADNPMTVEGVALGRQLFFDPILSIDSTIACGSCHLPEFAFSDTAQFSRGVAGVTGRNSMSIANLAWAPSLFWDGRAATLEAQVLMPVADAVEMGETWDNVEGKLRRHAGYPALFEAAFPGQPITRDHVARAIAQYERTLLSGESRYDRFLRGEVGFSDAELAGERVFNSERGDCFHCHGTVLLSDNRFHNNGLDADPTDAGRAGVTGAETDRGRFRTPTLRNIELTPPYMHDGRFATLEEVLDHYDGGLHRNELLDPLLLGTSEERRLTADERAALIAFLRTLTDPGFIEAHAP